MDSDSEGIDESGVFSSLCEMKCSETNGAADLIMCNYEDECQSYVLSRVRPIYIELNSQNQHGRCKWTEVQLNL